MGNAVRLSVTVITLNEERNIGRCLDSVASVADEIVVVDSLSTDRTRKICREKGARVVRQPFLGYVEQKNFAVDQASHDHILALDADECLSEELRESILEAKADWRASGHTMNRFNNYYGQWMHHSAVYPERKLRLWDRREGKWGGTNPHDKVLMHKGGKVRHLKGNLLHYAYDTVESHVRQANHFSTIAAGAYHAEGRRSDAFQVVVHSGWRFLRDYFFRRGFLDGFAGLTACTIHAHMTFLKYAKLRTLQREQALAAASSEEPPAQGVAS